MKKIFFLIPLLLLSSCSTKIEPFRFEEKYYEDQNKGLHEFNVDNLIDLQNKKESFGVFLYLDGCLTCKSFKPIVENYIVEKKISLYSISFNDIGEKENEISKTVKYAPSVCLFNKGKLVTYLDANKDEHISSYTTSEGFASWFETYIEF